ncbi:hypothetical protein OAU13_00930 [bacterium]|nr:hypothetical protein [bacterium]
MSLLYRSSATKLKVAELVVNYDNIVCVLTDKTTKTVKTIICLTVPQAERLIEQFLRPKNPY